MEKALVIAPHPDDETLGCGGTILKYIKNNHKVYWLIVTAALVEEGFDKARVLSRQKEIEKVSELFGFEKVIELKVPTTKADQQPLSDLIRKISKVFNEIKPSKIFLPNHSDVHTDHQVVFKAAFNCTKNFRYPYIKEVLMYETISETEFTPALNRNVFIPNVYVDIEDFFDKKIEIFKVYNSEVMDTPFPRSISAVEAIAKYRGSFIGKKYAEAFSLLKRID